MSLPIKAIDRIFERLAATYMASWDRAMGATPQADIKTAWAHELSAFGQTRELMGCIAWALENLPETPPNAIQFKRLCKQAPMPDAPRLEAPKADPERMAQELSRLAPLKAEVRAKAAGHDFRAWAKALKARHEAGDNLTRLQVTMYREALGEAA